MMVDSDHLQIPSVPNGSATPKRGHRHKRSFAISEDFEFIKQTPGSPQEISECFTTSPTRNNNLSPRFFVSEEPTFSRGVPDAIIDLDDALTTKPRSFRSHRRAESAPADLNLPIRACSPRRAFSIEEEDSEGENEERKETVLLSPLRTNSESPNMNNAAPFSPIPSRVGQINNNTLKIHKQKERYYNYTKQIPATTPQTRNHSNSQQTSLSSLSSGQNSSATTPPGIASTPNTPIFCTMKSARSDSPNGTFQFESQIYELPAQPRLMTRGAAADNDDNTLKGADSEHHHNIRYRRSRSLAECSNTDASRIPKEILMGQPGEITDLSPQQECLQKQPSREQRQLEAMTSPFLLKNSAEVVDACDSAVGPDKAVPTRERKRGRFNIISILFSKLKNQR